MQGAGYGDHGGGAGRVRRRTARTQRCAHASDDAVRADGDAGACEQRWGPRADGAVGRRIAGQRVYASSDATLPKVGSNETPRTSKSGCSFVMRMASRTRSPAKTTASCSVWPE